MQERGGAGFDTALEFPRRGAGLKQFRMVGMLDLQESI
jgi:hypothetical protein